MFIANSKNCSFYRSSNLEPEELLGSLLFFLTLTVLLDGTSATFFHFISRHTTSTNYTFPILLDVYMIPMRTRVCACVDMYIGQMVCLDSKQLYSACFGSER